MDDDDEKYYLIGINSEIRKLVSQWREEANNPSTSIEEARTFDRCADDLDIIIKKMGEVIDMELIEIKREMQRKAIIKTIKRTVIPEPELPDWFRGNVLDNIIFAVENPEAILETKQSKKTLGILKDINEKYVPTYEPRGLETYR